MCLLVVASRVAEGTPLVVAANRDELYGRPALAMTVLRESGPRILGGRDELAGGTWMAINEHGVVAGLTNRPSRDGRDPDKRTRGELPLFLARHSSAKKAVKELTLRIDPSDYNAAWILCGDRDSLIFVDLTTAGAPRVEELEPGIHVLENNPLEPPSTKVTHVRTLLGDTGRDRAKSGTRDTAVARLGDIGRDLVEPFRALLSDHSIPLPTDPDPVAAGMTSEPGEPAGSKPAETGPADTGPADGAPPGRGPADGAPPDRGPARPLETLACCVHTEIYGTRSAELVVVPAPLNELPRVEYTEGPSCTSPWRVAGWPASDGI